METPLTALRFSCRIFYRSFALAVACKPFVSAASCRTITSGKASFPQHVIPTIATPFAKPSVSIAMTPGNRLVTQTLGDFSGRVEKSETKLPDE
jgi:hypothetical protein